MNDNGNYVAVKSKINEEQRRLVDFPNSLLEKWAGNEEGYKNISTELKETVSQAVVEKLAVIPRYLENYAHLQPSMSSVSLYSSVGPFSLHKIDNYYAIYNSSKFKIIGGIPYVRSNIDSNEYVLNPVTVAQAALLNYGLHVIRQEPLDTFDKLISTLIQMVDKDGALPYEYSWSYHGEIF